MSDLYGRRMSIEMLFRDGKNKRDGWSLRDTGLHCPNDWTGSSSCLRWLT